MNPDSGVGRYAGPRARETASGHLLRDSNRGRPVTTQRGGMGWDGVGRGRGAPEGGETRVHLWLIHAGEWQKATPHYKASVLQLKTKTLK